MNYTKTIKLTSVRILSVSNRELGFQFNAGIVNLSEPSAQKKCLTFGTVFQYKFLDAILKKYKKNSQFNSIPAIWHGHVFCLLNLL